MSTELPVDVDVLREEIEKTYTEVSTEPGKDFIFPTGRAWAEDLGYPSPSSPTCPSGASRASPASRTIGCSAASSAGATVLDLGCGAGTDLLIAAQMVGAGRARDRRST